MKTAMQILIDAIDQHIELRGLSPAQELIVVGIQKKAESLRDNEEAKQIKMAYCEGYIKTGSANDYYQETFKQ